jgi:hypothetical protein
MNGVKPGWRTSEFIVTVVAAIIPLINQAFGLNIPVEALVGIAGSIAAYVLSRGLAKAAKPPA